MKDVYGEEIEFTYDKNETMQLLGKQYPIDLFWCNIEVRKQIDHISEAHPYSFTLDSAADIFMLGFIHGKREERARRKRTL